MPLGSREDCGTNHDGTSSEEYCRYCFQDGAFTSECTMEQMIEHCARFVEEFNKENGSSYTKEEAIAQMTLFFPTLKRWKKPIERLFVPSLIHREGPVLFSFVRWPPSPCGTGCPGMFKNPREGGRILFKVPFFLVRFRLPCWPEAGS